MVTRGNKMAFFSKNKKTAVARVKKLAKSDKYYKNKTAKLAKRQIAHSSKWKTWKIVGK